MARWNVWFSGHRHRSRFSTPWTIDVPHHKSNWKLVNIFICVLTSLGGRDRKASLVRWKISFMIRLTVSQRARDSVANRDPLHRQSWTASKQDAMDLAHRPRIRQPRRKIGGRLPGHNTLAVLGCQIGVGCELTAQQLPSLRDRGRIDWDGEGIYATRQGGPSLGRATRGVCCCCLFQPQATAAVTAWKHQPVPGRCLPACLFCVARAVLWAALLPSRLPSPEVPWHGLQIHFKSTCLSCSSLAARVPSTLLPFHIRLLFVSPSTA